jgi:hypothetical protein
MPLPSGTRARSVRSQSCSLSQCSRVEGQLLELGGGELDLRIALGDLTAVLGVDRRHAIEQLRGDAAGGLGIETLEVFSLEVTHIEHGHRLWSVPGAQARARNATLPLQRLHACDDLRLRESLPRQPKDERVELLLGQRECFSAAVAGLRP